MKLAPSVLVLLLVSLAPPLAGAQEDLLKSRAELTHYEETSRYDEVIRFINELQKRGDRLRVESFGRSEEGRALPLMILADPPISRPREARTSRKAVIFIIANIHAGEVEGKEAALHLARRIATGDLRPLLDKLIILIAPIYNADGNEKISLQNRTAQNGPVGGVGTRENARGLDLNRDFMKLESSEARALVRLFNRWDPHLTVDLHTTNGSYHGYHLTYAPSLNPDADARLIHFERDKMLAAITKTMLGQHKFRTYYYGNFSEPAPGESQREEKKSWRTFDHHPRFGNNYEGLRNRLAILSEAYSYLDFRGRIEATVAFVEEIFKYSAAHADEIVQLIKRVDQDMIQQGLGSKPAQLGVDFEMKPLSKPVEILVGEVEKKRNPRSGRDMTAMIEHKFTRTRMPDYGIFEATRGVAVPRAYLFRADAGLRPALDKLLQHGIAVEELTEPLTTEVENFVIDNINRAARPFQGHNEVRLKGHAQKETLAFPTGTILVRTAQPLATLAFYLLEAESDDGLVTWNFLDSYLQQGKVYPIYKLMQEAKVSSRLVERRRGLSN
ncbi:MAG TPA: M14 family metallopeptidase [Acidobacteriota bacterium]|jgi:hypothetical protein|nr:M14 family metallopeptidase [Acidobacteriota bacterium]